MLKKISLINFRQHRDRVVLLTPGLNVIRGANEIGKSSLCEAIGYAFYGSTFLREPLADVVSWGEPESTLRVEIEFEHDGVPGLLKRGKSGASLQHGTTLVTGQTEVSSYFERLFGASAKMASSLQIASQNKVRGTVEGGGAAAVSLIESLADFSLLESLIDRIQQHRPYGSTAPILERLERAKMAAEAEVPAPVDGLQLKIAKQQLKDAEAALAVLEARHQASVGPVAQAEEALAAAARIQTRRRAGQQRVAQIEAQLAKPVVTEFATAAQVEEWRVKAELQKQLEVRLAAYAILAPRCAYSWEGTREAFEADRDAKLKLQVETTSARHKAQLRKTELVALKINEDTCSFCKKDLRDVPEVAKRNAEADAEIAEVVKKITALETTLVVLSEELEAYRQIEIADGKAVAAYPAMYWDVDVSVIPRKATWKGDVPVRGQEFDYAGWIREAEASWKEVAKDQGQRTALAAELVTAQAEAALDVPDTAASEAVLEGFKTLKEEVQQAQIGVTKATGNVRLVEAELRAAQAARQAVLDGLQKAKVELQSLKDELDKTAFFNELIKKIRNARPVVASKLWALVLGAVSHYTAMGRGEPSAVTRNEDGFKINGKGIKGYSGSAQDVLGLAVRLALLKTFLPNTPFMIMDEIAAACDDDRELNLLGMVLAADIPQVLLVTHSDAAESFATNLVQI